MCFSWVAEESCARCLACGCSCVGYRPDLRAGLEYYRLPDAWLSPEVGMSFVPKSAKEDEEDEGDEEGPSESSDRGPRAIGGPDRGNAGLWRLRP